MIRKLFHSINDKEAKLFIQSGVPLNRLKTFRRVGTDFFSVRIGKANRVVYFPLIVDIDEVKSAPDAIRKRIERKLGMSVKDIRILLLAHIYRYDRDTCLKWFSNAKDLNKAREIIRRIFLD